MEASCVAVSVNLLTVYSNKWLILYVAGRPLPAKCIVLKCHLLAYTLLKRLKCLQYAKITNLHSM